MLPGNYSALHATAIACTFIELRQTSALGSLCPMPIPLSRPPTMTTPFCEFEHTKGFCCASCIVEYLVNFWCRPDVCIPVEIFHSFELVLIDFRTSAPMLLLLQDRLHRCKRHHVYCMSDRSALQHHIESQSQHCQEPSV
jgi:hypothetical protein